MSLFGLDWLQINQLAGRALQFQVGQLELRLQYESDRYQQLEKKHSKLKQTIKEVHTKNVTAMNIMEGRLNEALKELDTERARSAMYQKKMQEESRQKRRLEDEVQQRRWQRSSFLTTTLTAPLKRIAGDGAGAASGAVQSDASAHASTWATGRKDKEVKVKTNFFFFITKNIRNMDFFHYFLEKKVCFVGCWPSTTGTCIHAYVMPVRIADELRLLAQHA
jgi:hypothetical protein